MVTPSRRPKRALVVGAAVAAGLLLVTGCGSRGGSAAASKGFSFTGLNTTPHTPANTITALKSSSCSAAQKRSALSTNTIAQTAMDQKYQLLAGQNALPDAFIAPNAPSLADQFIKAGQIADVSTTLGSTASSEILPAAASTVKAIYGSSDLYALPNEFNIEGIWYNKKVFADNGISVPSTWDDLVADMAKLKSADVQPVTADGKDGWDVTRWVGAYLFRDLGPDALKDVEDGKAKLTDAKYVAAANAVAQLGKDGYFGANVASNDYNGSVNDFLTGKAAMIYMGSWMLSNVNDAKQDTIGAANVGFMPFPTVSGGEGSIDQVPANVGQPIMFAKKSLDAGSKAWMTCIAKNYGDEVLSKYGVISGFKLHESHTLPATTQAVQDQITNAKSSVLWFEALFSAKATTVSQTNGGLLGNGSLSGSDFMQKVQAAL